MVYTGHVRNGVVFLDGSVRLPEGTQVEVVVPVQPGPDNALPQARIMEFAGKFTGLPEDASRNLEHYLYGAPKR